MKYIEWIKPVVAALLGAALVAISATYTFERSYAAPLVCAMGVGIMALAVFKLIGKRK